MDYSFMDVVVKKVDTREADSVETGVALYRNTQYRMKLRYKKIRTLERVFWQEAWRLDYSKYQNLKGMAVKSKNIVNGNVESKTWYKYVCRAPVIHHQNT